MQEKNPKDLQFQVRNWFLLLLAFSIGVNATTPGFDTLVNYDTAWTFVYDGGKYKDGTAI